MAASPQTTAEQKAITLLGRNGLLDKYFYFAMSLLAVPIAVAGFSITIDKTLIHPAIPPPVILWIHAAVFTSWLAFFIIQSSLVRIRKVKWHRTLGWFGAAIGATMPPLGIATAISMGHLEVYQLGETDRLSFVAIQFYDMLAFAALLGFAIWFRKKPEIHRRLIFIATYGLLDAPIARFQFPFHHGLFYMIVDLLISLGAARDLLVNRQIHKVYLIVLPILLLFQGFATQTWMRNATWWLDIAQKLLR
jgi:hypothetical protein